MKLSSILVVRSAIGSLGFAFLAVACGAQSSDPTGTSSQAFTVGHYYTCASTGACGAISLDAGAMYGGTTASIAAACAAVSGCTWIGAPTYDCAQTTPCATGDLKTAEECTVNPVCEATEHTVITGCTNWCGTRCCS